MRTLLWWCIGTIICILIGICPLAAVVLIATLTGGAAINEGNSALGAVPWLLFYSIPISVVLEILVTALAVVWAFYKLVGDMMSLGGTSRSVIDQ